MEALRRLGKEYDSWVLQAFQARAAADPPPPDSSRGKQYSTISKGATGISSVTTTVPATAQGATASRTVVFRASPLQQLVRSVIHAVSLGVAYIVMLLVMSYNGYVIICVIIGGGLGKFFCDWMTSPIVVRDGCEIGGEEFVAGIEEPSMCCG